MIMGVWELFRFIRLRTNLFMKQIVSYFSLIRKK